MVTNGAKLIGSKLLYAELLLRLHIHKPPVCYLGGQGVDYIPNALQICDIMTTINGGRLETDHDCHYGRPTC